MPERGREGKHLQVDGKFPTCKANKEEKINLKNNQQQGEDEARVKERDSAQWMYLLFVAMT